MKIEILSATNKKLLHTVDDVSIYTTIGEIKEIYQNAKGVVKCSQSFRKEQRGKMLDDSVTLRSLDFDSIATLYFKDLGPQVGWKTVFVAEYAGPFVLYALFYLRPNIIYGAAAAGAPIHQYVKIACGCWLFHYAKRILETIYVHRFSNSTMPIKNLFKNCTYYWGFTSFIAYYINHPLYTPALYGDTQVYISLVAFFLCQLGNYSIHTALRDLRPEGTKERKIPIPTSNPFTKLFSLVSCPNYTYEMGTWFWFTIMTQSVAPGIFALLGTAQMTQWAIKKHVNYKKEFKDYPKGRKAIIPFIV